MLSDAWSRMPSSVKYPEPYGPGVPTRFPAKSAGLMMPAAVRAITTFGSTP